MWKAQNCLVPSAMNVQQTHTGGNITSITVDPKVLMLGKDFRDQRCKRMLLGRRLHTPVFPKRATVIIYRNSVQTNSSNFMLSVFNFFEVFY